MKYRVVGWTEYDNSAVEAAECSEAALCAIIADIKANGYLFTGYDHQERLNGAPVLNDGKKRLFSQREFGSVMARARGDFSRMGYAAYAFSFGVDANSTVMPGWEKSFSPDTFTPDTDMSEEFVLTVSAEQLERAQGAHALTVVDVPSLTYIDRGDILILTCETESASYLVEELDRKKVLTEETLCEDEAATCDNGSRLARLSELSEQALWVVSLRLRPKSGK